MGDPLSWFYPSPYTPGPAPQQFPKAHGRAGQRQSQGVTQHTEGRGGQRNWTEGKLGDLVDTAVFGDSKDLLLQFLFLNFFFLTYFPVTKAENYRQGKSQMSGSKISPWICGNQSVLQYVLLTNNSTAYTGYVCFR